MKEYWVDIKGYEGLYQVSNLGRVRSLDRVQYNPVAATHQTLHKGHILPQRKNDREAMMVMLRNAEGKRKNCQVHRLVAMAFLPNPDNLPVVNHKDYDRSNNCVDNLEWCTHYYNVHYGRADELRKQNQYGCKAVLKYSLDGELLKEYPRIMDAVRENPPATRQNIRECCKGKIKTCAGYKWKFK